MGHIHQSLLPRVTLPGESCCDKVWPLSWLKVQRRDPRSWRGNVNVNVSSWDRRWTSYHVSERNGYLKGKVQLHTELRLTKFGTLTLGPDPWFNSEAEWNWTSKLWLLGAEVQWQTRSVMKTETFNYSDSNPGADQVLLPLAPVHMPPLFLWSFPAASTHTHVARQ